MGSALKPVASISLRWSRGAEIGAHRVEAKRLDRRNSACLRCTLQASALGAEMTRMWATSRSAGRTTLNPPTVEVIKHLHRATRNTKALYTSTWKLLKRKEQHLYRAHNSACLRCTLQASALRAEMTRMWTIFRKEGRTTLNPPTVEVIKHLHRATRNTKALYTSTWKLLKRKEQHLYRAHNSACLRCTFRQAPLEQK